MNRMIQRSLRLFVVLTLLSMVLSGCAASGKPETSKSEVSSVPSGPYYASPEEVTAEKIKDMTVPATILNSISGFRNDFTLEPNAANETPGATVSSAYIRDDEWLYGTQFVDYVDGSFTHLYFTNDPRDPYMYAESKRGHERSKADSASVEYIFKTSFLGYDMVDKLTILSVTPVKSDELASDLPLDSQEGTVNADTSSLLTPEQLAKTGISEFYVVLLKTEVQEELYSTDLLLLDPESGHVHAVIVTYPEEDGRKETTQKMTFTYDSELKLDLSPKTGEKVNEEGLTPSVTPLNERPIFTFSTVDIQGHPFTSEQLQEAKLVLVNLWEPWCGPCVREMPDLEALYQKYKDQGLLILGAYTATNREADAKAILEDHKITYPIIVAENTLLQCATEYVPTSYFLLGDGRLLSTQPIVGANNYDSWEKLIVNALKEAEQYYSEK